MSRARRDKKFVSKYVRAYLLRYLTCIHVRERVNGKWASPSLSELPGFLRKRWIRKFVAQRQTPIRTFTQDELEELLMQKRYSSPNLQNFPIKLPSVTHRETAYRALGIKFKSYEDVTRTEEK